MSKPTSTQRSPARSRSGFAMVIVMITLAATLMMVALHQRHLTSALQLESAATRSQQFQEGPLTAMAEGMELLVTGLPPTDNYVCGLSLPTSAGNRFFRLTFSRVTASDWTVEAVEVPNLSGLILAPKCFTRLSS